MGRRDGRGASDDWVQRPLPRALLDVDLTSECALPRYLTLRDRVWVQEAQERIAALVGERRDDVECRLRVGPAWGERPLAWRAMTQLLLRQRGFALRCEGVAPEELRELLFRRAAETRASASWREDAVACAADALHRTPLAIEEGLLADLPSRRRLLGPAPALAPEFLIERYNLALVQGLLGRAERVELRLEEQVKAVLREARLRQLLVLAQVDRDPGDGVTATRVHVSGPLALFGCTERYGRSLAQWLPVVTTLRGAWRLRASLRWAERRVQLELTQHDPLGSARALPRRFDSAVEARLFADLARAPGGERWQVLREADPVQLGRRIVCPDFVLVERATGQRVPVEIVGYWTPAYLRDKLALLAALPATERWVLCVDESLAAELAAELPEASILRYRRRVDAARLLERLRGGLGRGDDPR